MRRAVMFDFGGTLMSYAHLVEGRRRVVEPLARALGYDGGFDALAKMFARGLAETMPTVTARPFYYQWEISAAAYRWAADAVNHALHEDEARHLARTRLRESVSQATLRVGVLETLGRLRERGYFLSIVSNIEDEDLAGAIDRLGLVPYFDATLTSEAARSCKPDAAIFNLALAQAACRPSEAVFVGDTPAHDIDGAAAMGLETVLVLDTASVPMRDLPGTHQADHVIREIPELLDVLG